MRKRNRRRCLLAVVVMLLIPCSLRAQTVMDPKVGYRVTLPAGWKEIPDAAMRQMVSAMTKPGAADAPQFNAAFEPADHSTLFQYPYAIVEVIDFKPGTDRSSFSKSELDELVAQMAGIPTNQLKQGVSDEASKLISDPKIDSPAVITSPPGFVMGTKLNVAGIGAVRGRTVCVLGRRNAVFLHFYAKEDDWAAQTPVMEQFAASLRRTPEQQVAFVTITPLSGGRAVGLNWGRVLLTAAIGAVIGGLVGLLGWFVKRSRT